MSGVTALRGSPRREELWRDFNVFVAAFIVLASFGLFLFVIPASLLLKLVLPARQAELYAYPAAYVLVALTLSAYWWQKHGLSPRQLGPGRERRFRNGHVLLLVCNLILLPVFAFPWMGLGSWIPHSVLPGIALPLLMFAPYGAIAGIIMVLGAGGKPPELAPTLPVKPAEVTGAQRPVAVVPTSQEPSATLVVVGLVASSFLLYVTTVFSALGFQGNTGRFTNVVLPVVGVCYVFYLAITIYLLTQRKNASIWLAWSPVVLLVMGSPIMMLVGAIGSVFR